jgi:tRNA (guanine37-N1)-methyltransferase
MFVDYELSIGEYVLTGGEIASQVLIDSMIRLKPGVLGSSISQEEESFSPKLDRQKEYPVYTRPQDFRGLKVPDILVSGDHKKIDIWKKDNLR